MSKQFKPRLRLMIAPGTLHSRGCDRMDYTRYGRSGKPRMSGDELLPTLPELAAYAEIDVDPGNPHEVATHEDLRRLAVRVEKTLAGGEVDGIVFVQGTNSLEETAYFLNLTVRSDKPIVVTGAQRPYTALSTDGPLNLLNAVRVAVAPETRGKGVVVVMNDEINAARDVTKTNTYRVQTFRSRDLGLLGYADPDAIVYYRAPTRGHTSRSEFDLHAVERMPLVDVLYVHSGCRAGLAEAALLAGARGIVIAGSGAGSSGNLAAELGAIAANRRAVIVQSSRVGEGRVLRENNWNEPGMVAADNLPPHKAAILLSLALLTTNKPDDIQKLFDTY
jgi:L-asparaginase type II